MKTHFTADHHFGHAKIIQMCGRPFATLDEMDEALIARWNAVVSPGDTVWHLGDFAYRCHPKRMRAIFERLNGYKHLVEGNHDNGATRSLPWASVRDFARIKVGDRHLVMFHYAMRTWPGARRGAVHLYGHSHNKLPGLGASEDVGVDAWDYAPTNLEAVLERIDARGGLQNARQDGQTRQDI